MLQSPTQGFDAWRDGNDLSGLDGESLALDVQPIETSPIVVPRIPKMPRYLSYYEGAPKPVLRGALHFLALLASPWWGGLVQQASGPGASTTCHAVSTIQVVCVTLGLTASVLYHRVPWPSREAEMCMRKVDLMGIVLMIAGMSTPPISLGLHIDSNALLVCIWSVSCALCIAIWKDTFTPMLYLGFGAFIVCSALPEAIYANVLLPHEWQLLALFLALYALSVPIYLHKWLHVNPTVWASHESFHLVSLTGIILNSVFNISMLRRLCT